MAIRRFSGAAEQLRQAMQIKPDYAEAYYTLGTVLKQMNNYLMRLTHCARRFDSILISPALTPRWRRFCANWATMLGLRRKARPAPR